MSIAANSKLIARLLNDKYRAVYRAVSVAKPTITAKHHVPFNSFHLSSRYDAVVSFKLADIGEGIKDVVVKEWFVKEGDKVAQFDNICEVQSDKASVTITSRFDGVVKKIHHKVDAIALVGKPLLDIEIEGEDETDTSSSSSSDSDAEKIDEATSISKNEELTSSTICVPSVRRLAKENKINLSEVKGSGKKGRILKEDVLRYLESKGSPSTVQQVPIAQEPIPVSTVSRLNVDRVEPLQGFQRTMVKTMSEALKIPHFLLCEEIAVTKLNALRQSVKVEAEKRGAKLTMMPFFVKAASNALSRYPILNSSYNPTTESITYYAAHNVGIAMDTKLGLAVPVIKNVQQLSIMEIAKELNRLMLSGKNGSFSMDDVTGGTFTLSNIGIVGGTYASPVILPPQVAIIAIGATKRVPRFDESNNVIAEDVLCVSGSADHRIVDGVSMARFLGDLKKQLEEPNYLFLNL